MRSHIYYKNKMPKITSTSASIKKKNAYLGALKYKQYSDEEATQTFCWETCFCLNVSTGEAEEMLSEMWKGLFEFYISHTPGENIWRAI